MTRRSYLSFVVLGALASTTLPNTAHAADFIYTLTGTGGSGIGPGGAFSGANFTLIGIGDTTTLSSPFGFPLVSLASLTYNISGVTTGAATVSNPSALFHATTSPGHFSFAGFLGGSTGFSNTGMTGWDLISPIGPISVSFWGSATVGTDQGSLKIDGWTSATFSAAPYSVTPEAPGVAMLLPGLLPVAAMALKRRRNRK